MKNLLFTLLACIGLISCSKAQMKEFSPESLKEPIESLEKGSSNLFDLLEKHKGKTLVIEIWASWCSDCVKAMPRLKQIQNAHPEVDFAFISMDKSAEKWKAGIEKHELKGDHYWVADGMKGKFGQSIDLDWIPRYIIIDKTGKIVTWRAIEKDFDAIDKTLTQLK